MPNPFCFVGCATELSEDSSPCLCHAWCALLYCAGRPSRIRRPAAYKGQRPEKTTTLYFSLVRADGRARRPAASAAHLFAMCAAILQCDSKGADLQCWRRSATTDAVCLAHCATTRLWDDNNHGLRPFLPKGRAQGNLHCAL